MWVPETRSEALNRRNSPHPENPCVAPVPAARIIGSPGSPANPTGAWTTQAARNLFLRHNEQLDTARAPVQTPVATTFAERWIGSIRRGTSRPHHHLESPPARAPRDRLHRALQRASRTTTSTALTARSSNAHGKKRGLCSVCGRASSLARPLPRPHLIPRWPPSLGCSFAFPAGVTTTGRLLSPGCRARDVP